MSGFDLLHTYSSDALAQGILKSCFDLLHTYSSDALAQGILKSCFDLLHTYPSDALAQGILKYILYVCRVLTYYTHIQVTHWLRGY